MKVEELKKGRGKTTKCLKRMAKLVIKGENVIYITPITMSRAHTVMGDFLNYIKEKAKRTNRLLNQVNYGNNTIYFMNGSRIRFMSFETWQKTSNYFNRTKIIVDDIDILFDYRLDMITVTKYSPMKWKIT